jgi:DNA invertase Pin-like site-specific DNA recombinase
MGNELIQQTLRGDLTGMNFGIIARMSNESRRRKHLKTRAENPEAAPSYRTGLDIDTRDRQVIRCTRWIESRGGRVVDVYDEPHTSAWKRRPIVEPDGSVIYRVKRPVYQRALKDLARGVAKNGERMDGLMATDADRITRSNRDLEDAIDVVEHWHRPILELSGTLDLLTDNGRTNARVIVSFKNGQSADTARRVRDMHEALQENGIPTGGHRPFGWMEDKRTLHPTEAPLLQQAVKDVLGGRSLDAICAEWNRNGIPTARGKTWRSTNLRTMLRNPRVAGYRMQTLPRDGQPGGGRYATVKLGPDGKPVIGQWQRLIEPEQWEALKSILGEAPRPGDGKNARVYLSTGTLRCGKCDYVLRAQKATPSENKPAGYFWYTCPSKGSGGCGGVKISGPETDEAIREIVLAKWELEAASRETTQAPAEWDGTAKLERVYENMAALKAARKADPPKITAERYYADLAEYESEERELIRQRNKFIRRAHAAASVPVNLRADWTCGRLTLSEQRGYVQRALSAVVVAPAGRKGKVPVDERLTPVPAPEPEA